MVATSIPEKLLPGLVQIRGSLSEYRTAWIGSMFIFTNDKKTSQLRTWSWCQQSFFIAWLFWYPQIRLFTFMINDRELHSEKRIVRLYKAVGPKGLNGFHMRGKDAEPYKFHIYGRIQFLFFATHKRLYGFCSDFYKLFIFRRSNLYQIRQQQINKVYPRINRIYPIEILEYQMLRSSNP